MTTLINNIANIILIAAILIILINGQRRRIAVYDSFIDGAKGGFDVVLRLIPFLVGMLVAIGMLRSSGFFTSLANILSPILTQLNVPSDIIPLALIRPFTGGGSLAMVGDIAHTHGGDSPISIMAATLYGSSETTFYIVAVYFGSVGIKRTRHAIPAGLLADFSAVIASVTICNLLFAH